MAVYFQSICSSSSGNCLTVWTERTRIVIDCGLSSMKRTRAVIESMREPNVNAVLLSHLHSDHISYYPLRTLEINGIPVYVHEECARELKLLHFSDYGFKELTVNTFSNRPFVIGDFLVKPFVVPHMPGYLTCGFEMFAEDKKLVVATDFLEWTGVFDNFVDADFIFVESNHDMQFLRKYCNPNSRFHMPNPRTADLLVNVQRYGKRRIQSVMLGHISSQRNEPSIAIAETKRSFLKADLPMQFELFAAPLKETGNQICIL